MEESNNRSFWSRFNPKTADNPKMIYLWIFLILTYAAALLIPQESIIATALTLIPTIVIFIYVIISRDFIQGFIFGSLLIYIMLDKIGGVMSWIDAIIGNLADEDNMFMIVIFMLIGGIIRSLQYSGAAKSFGEWATSKLKSKKSSLLVTFVLNVLMSVDDYINSLTIGTTMTPINDKNGIPREMSAYVLRASASAPSLMYPMGDWGYFVVLQLVSLGLCASVSEAASTYVTFIPYLFYPVITMIVCLLVIFGVIPKFGKMKDAYSRVAEGGPISPNAAEEEEIAKEIAEELGDRKLHPAFFIIPVLFLIFGLVLTDFDGIKSSLITLTVIAVMYIGGGVFTLNDFFGHIVEGMKDMLDLTLLLIFGYVIGGGMEDMGFADFIVNVTANSGVSPALLPFIVFTLFCCTEFLCTLNWTLYIIALPIIFEVCNAVGANLPMTVAALLSAGMFGSNACFYSDGGIIVSKSAKIDLYTHAFSSYFYMIIAAVISAVMYLGAGLILG
ncbi:MAG TPA: Na+/H+ antiporter NhaC family protein [Bacillota bacterium]|nr:Na+/H+ antiporter NhaC family protein [Bacillota bacterium]